MTGDRAGGVSGRGLGRVGLALLVGLVALAATAAHAGGEDVGPDLKDLRMARAAARRFRAPGGLRQAVHTVCRSESLPEDEAAAVVLTAHGARALPLLLDTVPAPHASRAARSCWSSASRVARSAVCTGRSGGGGYGLDRRSDAAVARDRARAQRALVRALTGRSPAGHTAAGPAPSGSSSVPGAVRTTRPRGASPGPRLQRW